MVIKRTLISKAPGGAPLTECGALFGVVLPVPVRNMIANPSFEVNLARWYVKALIGAVVTSPDGKKSLRLSPIGGSGVLHELDYMGFPCCDEKQMLMTGEHYEFMAKFWPDTVNDFTVAVYAGFVKAGEKTFSNVQPGGWTEVRFDFTAPNDGLISLRITPANITTSVDNWNIDEVAVMPVAVGEHGVYIDGDSPDGAWDGEPNNSTSYVVSGAACMGRTVWFDDPEIGMLITGFAHGGEPPVKNVTTPFGMLPGSDWQRQTEQERTLQIYGALHGTDRWELLRRRNTLAGLVRQGGRQVCLRFQNIDETGSPLGPELSMIVAYAGGLEGTILNNNQEMITLALLAADPYAYENEVQQMTLAAGLVSVPEEMTGTAESSPIIRFYGPGTFRGIRNRETGDEIRLVSDYALSAHEIVEIRTTPRGAFGEAFQSSVNGNLLSLVDRTRGHVTDFVIAPGAQTLEVMGDDDLNGVILWRKAHTGLDAVAGRGRL